MNKFRCFSDNVYARDRPTDVRRRKVLKSLRTHWLGKCWAFSCVLCGTAHLLVPVIHDVCKCVSYVCTSFSLSAVSLSRSLYVCSCVYFVDVLLCISYGTKQVTYKYYRGFSLVALCVNAYTRKEYIYFPLSRYLPMFLLFIRYIPKNLTLHFVFYSWIFF